MSDLKSAKDALVASLFELSRAAQDAATATVNFYKVAAEDTNAAESLRNLGDTLRNIARATEGNVEEIIANDLGNVSLPSTDVATTAAAKKKAAGEEKPKKKKVERDPNAPKKPLTIFFAYSFHTREKIREDRKERDLPPLSALEMKDVVMDRWAKITPEEKSEWQKKYANELKSYQKEKEDYKATLPAATAAAADAEDASSIAKLAISEPLSNVDPDIESKTEKKKEKKRKSEKTEKSEKKAEKKVKK